MRQLGFVVMVLLACSSQPPSVDGGTAGGSATAGGAGGASGGGSMGGGAGGGAAGAGGGVAGGGAGGAAGGVAGGAGGGVAGGAAGGASCNQLESDYDAALSAAKRCNPTSLVNPCTGTRSNGVGCGCPTFLDPAHTGPLDALQNRYADAGCMPGACPRCVPVDAGVCVAFDAGAPSEGRCVDRY
ncbi:MAG: hypothetical protein IPJ65_19055 [Archangiaceae bacterium]|nr:hypothetical protein [Archangiaceae bacterium]